MDKEVATKVSELIDNITLQLDRSIKLVRKHCSHHEYLEYFHKVTAVNGALYDVIAPLLYEHPELQNPTKPTLIGFSMQDYYLSRGGQAQSLFELDLWVKSAIREWLKSCRAGVARRAEEIEELITTNYHGIDMFYALGAISDEFSLLEEHERSEILTRKLVGAFPEWPEAWIGLAKCYLESEKYEDANLAIQNALPLAYKTGNYVREAIYIKIYIALFTKHYAPLEEMLVALIDYVPSPASVDCELRDDIIKYIPRNAVKESTLENYKIAIINR